MMANSMHERGHSVVVFTFDDKVGASLWPLAEGIPIIHLREKDDETAHLEMVDVVAKQGLDLMVGLHLNRAFLRYVRCAFDLNLPLVLSEHCDPALPQSLGTFGRDERIIIMSGATLIHMISDEFRATLPKGLQDRIRVVPNTIREPDPGAPQPPPQAGRTIVTVSRLVPPKNTQRLIEVFAGLASEFPEWRLRIVGDGPEMGKLRRLARKCRVKDRVDFVGALKDPYPEYLAANIFATASLFEGFGLTLCEASAHGLPSVAYGACRGLRSQIRHGENGFLSSGGEELGSLADDLRTLMADQELREKMGRRAREMFVSRFSNEIVHAGWEDLFFEAVERGPNRAAPRPEHVRQVRLWDMIQRPLPIQDSARGGH
tara:strand:+ start:59021 stop:60142 length:1122 start_codon:yes stop_codon:yes gene_type:complete